MIRRGRRRIRFSARRAPSLKSQRFLGQTLGNSSCLQRAQVNGTQATTEYLNYDALARVCSNQQIAGASGPYTFNYQYNLDSGLTAGTYPSGRVVS